MSTPLVILFVDDELRLLEGLQRMLRSMRNEWEVLNAILLLLNAEGFDPAEALRDGVRYLSARLVENPLKVELASLLSPIGRVLLPPPVLIKARQGSKLDAAEVDMISRVPEVGANLLRHIPRLEEAIIGSSSSRITATAVAVIPWTP